MNLSIRRLQPGDEKAASQVAAVFKAAVLCATSAARFLANPANYLIAAHDRSQLAGFVLAYRLDRLDHSAGQLFVYEIGVLPEFQRQEVGTRLMEFVRQLVADNGLTEAFVFTEHANTAARRLYERTGGRVESDTSILFVYPGHAA